MAQGKIIKVSGPVIVAKEMKGSQMYEVVRVGEERLIGEIIELEGDKATVQVYEETAGIKPGEPVIGTGMPLSVELGPGILKNFFDGIQRPLDVIMSKTGIFISRGVDVPSLDRNKKWEFTPTAKKSSKVTGGDILGEVQETEVIKQRILVPPGIEGELVKLAGEGNYKIEETIAVVKTKEGEKELNMLQKWPVRKGRPYKEKLDPNLPLVTGQRVIDTFFPIAKGGTSAIPGGFGTGKTVMGHQLARWSDAKIFVYVGCGERGNEMTEVVEDFPKLIDPYTGKPLMERTVLIANTSNMPVAARDVSVYTGITLAEYYRDMGYDVALTADSTSRWAEAMREISGRLEEMPGEEGYPAYLASRLAAFYERAGRVITLGSGERYGSITVTGAVSPPGGDFSEPVTQNTLRITKVFWALDSSLADRRHFPSINWLKSYSLYLDNIQSWWTNNVAKDWLELRTKAMALLQKEAELMEIVKLVGPDALPERERVVLEGARVVREDFLQQSALDEVDTFCSSKKQYNMLSLMLKFYEKAMEAVSKGVLAKEIAALEVLDDIARIKYVPEKDAEKAIAKTKEKIEKQINALPERSKTR